MPHLSSQVGVTHGQTSVSRTETCWHSYIHWIRLSRLPLERTITERKVITLTSQWPRWRLKSPASRLFTQPFIPTQIKENIKAPRHWPLCGEFTGTGEFPAQRASDAENVSIWWRHHEDNVLQIINFVFWVTLLIVNRYTFQSGQQEAILLRIGHE